MSVTLTKAQRKALRWLAGHGGVADWDRFHDRHFHRNRLARFRARGLWRHPRAYGTARQLKKLGLIEDLVGQQSYRLTEVGKRAVEVA